MYIRPFRIKRSDYTAFMQKYSHIFSFTHTVLLPYTYGSIDLHIYKRRLTQYRSVC